MRVAFRIIEVLPGIDMGEMKPGERLCNVPGTPVDVFRANIEAIIFAGIVYIIEQMKCDPSTSATGVQNSMRWGKPCVSFQIIERLAPALNEQLCILKWTDPCSDIFRWNKIIDIHLFPVASVHE